MKKPTELLDQKGQPDDLKFVSARSGGGMSYIGVAKLFETYRAKGINPVRCGNLSDLIEEQ